MSTIAFNTDSTTLTLNGVPVNDFMAGDTMILTPINPLTSHQNGSIGVNINKRSDSGVHELTVNVQRNSDSDVFLGSAVNQEAPVVFNGSIKENFIKDGIAGVESWILESGSITTLPTHTKNDTDGNALLTYVIQFRFARRNQ